METLALHDLIAQIPDGLYFDPWKLVTMAFLFTLWAAFAQWVDKDTVAVNTYRTLWNIVAVATGVVATALMLFVPNFLIAILLFIVIYAACAITYVIHRNGLVEEKDKVCTPAHIQRLMKEGFSGKKKKQVVDVRERVILRGADGKRVEIPADEAEREQFRLAQDLLFDALWRRASFVHVTPAKEAATVGFEIDGVSVDRQPLARPDADGILAFFKRVAGLNLEERRKPQRGTIQSMVGDNKADIVVLSAGSTAGEKLTLRVIGEEKDYKLADIGFTDEQVEVLRALMIEDNGLVLLSAPLGGGLTTTVYSVTRSNDAFLKNIQTLEYEKELDIDNVTQHVHVPSEQKTFAADLQRIVRSDPDIIVLPEVRDRAAAVVATESAAGKQNVYVGLVASDVFDALRKWIKVVGDARLVARGLRAVANQRLVRVLCSECKQSYKPDPLMLRKINMPADKVLFRVPEPQYDKNGNPIICQNCHGTGYVGRTGVFEILVADEGLRKVIRDTGSVTAVQSYVTKKGREGLQQQALRKVFDGKTSIQEVVQATRSSSSSGKSAPRPKPRPTANDAA